MYLRDDRINETIGRDEIVIHAMINIPENTRFDPRWTEVSETLYGQSHEYNRNLIKDQT